MPYWCPPCAATTSAIYPQTCSLALPTQDALHSLPIMAEAALLTGDRMLCRRQLTPLGPGNLQKPCQQARHCPKVRQQRCPRGLHERPHQAQCGGVQARQGLRRAPAIQTLKEAAGLQSMTGLDWSLES